MKCTIVASFLSPLLCVFREGCGTQHALIRLIETGKKTLDKGGLAGTLLIDLSKAFDCLNHELFIAKVIAHGFSASAHGFSASAYGFSASAHGFSASALRLIHSYLSERMQRVKMNGSFSTWRETIVGVPQGSVLGPLLFKKYLNDIIMFLNDTQICNYADDATIHAWDNNREMAEWFPNNCTRVESM